MQEKFLFISHFIYNYCFPSRKFGDTLFKPIRKWPDERCCMNFGSQLIGKVLFGPVDLTFPNDDLCVKEFRHGVVRGKKMAH